MTDDEKIIISFIFKKNGKEQMKKSEFYLSLSMDLKWFKPEDAKKFTEIQIKKDFLKLKDDEIIPGFDINKIEIPLGYNPPKDIIEKTMKQDLSKNNLNSYEKIIKNIKQKTNKEDDEIKKEIESIIKEKNLTSEIAALLVLKKYETEKLEIPNDIEEKIFT